MSLAYNVLDTKINCDLTTSQEVSLVDITLMTGTLQILQVLTESLGRDRVQQSSEMELECS
jgi:hypothetical protein